MKSFVYKLAFSSSVVELLLATVVVFIPAVARQFAFHVSSKALVAGNYQVDCGIFRARLRP